MGTHAQQQPGRRLLLERSQSPSQRGCKRVATHQPSMCGELPVAIAAPDPVFSGFFAGLPAPPIPAPPAERGEWHCGGGAGSATQQLAGPTSASDSSYPAQPIGNQPAPPPPPCSSGSPRKRGGAGRQPQGRPLGARRQRGAGHGAGTGQAAAAQACGASGARSCGQARERGRPAGCIRAVIMLIWMASTTGAHSTTPPPRLQVRLAADYLLQHPKASLLMTIRHLRSTWEAGSPTPRLTAAQWDAAWRTVKRRAGGQ